MNILFALYHDFTANSAPHVKAIAEELQKLGHDCCVAVPNNTDSVSVLGQVNFRYTDYSGATSDPDSMFSNGAPPDLIHAWTPREMVRIFCENMAKIYCCPIFVHLEDNEWHLLSCVLKQPVKRIFRMVADDLDATIPVWLSHPSKAVKFMQAATGVTVIIDRLAELIPEGVPSLEIWPSADASLFSERERDIQQRRSLGIPENAFVLAYTGNVHSANAHEVRSLYLAVAVLNREGFPTVLVRAGLDFYPFLGPGERWARRYSLELGYVPHKEICSVLALADVLVQPGKSDAFNDYRFPSKLPEFLSVGRPVVLPNANIAKYMSHRKHGYILDEPSALGIVRGVREIMSDPNLYQTLQQGSLEFSRTYLNWSNTAQKLNRFYSQTISDKSTRFATV